MSDYQTQEKAIDGVVKSSVYLAIPFLFTLVIVLGVLFFTVVKSLAYKISKIQSLTETDAIVMALKAVDVILVVNLLLIVLIATYHRLIGQRHSDNNQQSEHGWIQDVTLHDMKKKLTASVVVISGINLLADLLYITKDKGELTFQSPVMVQALIHLVLAFSAYLMSKDKY